MSRRISPFTGSLVFGAIVIFMTFRWADGLPTKWPVLGAVSANVNTATQSASELEDNEPKKIEDSNREGVDYGDLPRTTANLENSTGCVQSNTSSEWNVTDSVNGTTSPMKYIVCPVNDSKILPSSPPYKHIRDGKHIKRIKRTGDSDESSADHDKVSNDTETLRKKMKDRAKKHGVFQCKRWQVNHHQQAADVVAEICQTDGNNMCTPPGLQAGQSYYCVQKLKDLTERSSNNQNPPKYNSACCCTLLFDSKPNPESDDPSCE